MQAWKRDALQAWVFGIIEYTRDSRDPDFEYAWSNTNVLLTNLRPPLGFTVFKDIFDVAWTPEKVCLNVGLKQSPINRLVNNKLTSSRPDNESFPITGKFLTDRLNEHKSNTTLTVNINKLWFV